MNLPAQTKQYTISDVIRFRSLTGPTSKDFLFLTDILNKVEPFYIEPNYYCFGMMFCGQVEVSFNAELHQLSKNSIMIYRPDQLFKVTDIVEGTRGAFVLFTKSFLDRLQENIFSIKSKSFLSLGIQNVIELRDGDRDRILSIFKEIFSLFGMLEESILELVARNLTSALIYHTDEILRPYIDHSQVPSNREMELYQRFINMVSMNFTTHRDLGFYTSKLSTNTDALRKTVKTICGKSPAELIIREVMSKASYLAAYTVKSFAVIGEELNFSDQYVFSKYFKKHAGHSPSDYRKYAKILKEVSA